VSSSAVAYAAAASQAGAGPGATDMTNQLTEVAADCPGTRFVVGGYSQGATVTSIALGIRTGVSRGTPIPRPPHRSHRGCGDTGPTGP
jgi:cutinase